MADGYTLSKLTDTKDMAPDFGMGEMGEARFCAEDLDAAGTGISHQRLNPGIRQPFGHKHENAEEVYVVLEGSGRVKLNDNIIDIERRDALRVAPGVIRNFEAGDDGLEFLAVGALHKGDGEIIQGWWTD